MSRAPRTEAEATIQEVLLIDTLQHHRDRTLQHLILERRNPDRSSLPAIPLGDVDTTHRGGLVPAGLEAVEQGLEVHLQMRCVVVRRLSVQSDGPVLSRSGVRRSEKLHVDVMSQAREHHLRRLSGQLGYPLSFR